MGPAALRAAPPGDSYDADVPAPETIALHDLGGEGPVVLLLHATGFCGMTLAPLAPVLATRCHVVAADLTGHGAAAAPPGDEPLSWHGTAQDLAVALQAADLGPLLVLGHSMGGAVGLALAAELPEAVDALYVYEPSIVEVENLPVGVTYLADEVRRRRAMFASRAEALAAYRDREPFRRFDERALAAYVEHGFTDLADGSVRLACTPDDEARTYLGNDIRPDDVANVTALVTIAHGVPGEFGGALVPPAVARALPHARVIEHDDLTHFGPFEQPGRIAREALAAFAPVLD